MFLVHVLPKPILKDFKHNLPSTWNECNCMVVGEENGNPLQYFCLENPMDGEAWWATVHEVAKSRTRLSNFTQGTSHSLQLHVQGWIWLKTWQDWGTLKVPFCLYYLAICLPTYLSFWLSLILRLALVLWWQNGTSSVKHICYQLTTEEKEVLL